jgi:hypothetical protein
MTEKTQLELFDPNAYTASYYVHSAQMTTTKSKRKTKSEKPKT